MGMRAKFLGHGRGWGGRTLESQWHHGSRPSTAHTRTHMHTPKWLRVLLAWAGTTENVPSKRPPRGLSH